METFSALLAFVRGIHQFLVNSPHKVQWRGASMFSLICAWINGWVNIGEAGDFRRHRAHYDVIVMNLSETYHNYKKTCVNQTQLMPRCVANTIQNRAWSQKSHMNNKRVHQYRIKAAPLTG